MKLLLIRFALGSLTVHAAPSTTLVNLPNSTISAVKAEPPEIYTSPAGKERRLPPMRS
jgi:hypothetical protein